MEFTLLKNIIESLKNKPDGLFLIGVMFICGILTIRMEPYISLILTIVVVCAYLQLSKRRMTYKIHKEELRLKELSLQYKYNIKDDRQNSLIKKEDADD